MSEHSLRELLKDEEYSYEHGVISTDETDETDESKVYFVRVENIKEVFVDTVNKSAASNQLKFVPGKKKNSIWSLLTGISS